MKAVVVRSIEDETGQRCVDLRREMDGTFAWVACRRDPEDGHGWRVVDHGKGGFGRQSDALVDAVALVGWLPEDCREEW